MKTTAEDSSSGELGPLSRLSRERSLSWRIAGLLLIASLLLIGQSLFNLSNLDDVDRSTITAYDTSNNLEELTRGIVTPIADIRMLSMESVLAPNQALVEEAGEALEGRIEDLEERLVQWQERLDASGPDAAGYSEFQAIRSAWERYREAQSKTAHFIEEGVRVAAFLSVTDQEKTHYEALQQAVADFGRTQLVLSQKVYDDGRENYTVAFYTLVATSVAQILILFAILYFVYRMFRSYMTAAELHERDLARARVAAEEANVAKSAFLANMSHELRTPMNAILGYSEMLVEEAEESGQDELIPDLKKIHQAGKHLLSLINDVLDLSKVESGKMEVYAEDFELDGLIDDVGGTAHPLMSTNQNQLTILRGENLGWAHQDLTKLRQALLNLISNAAKFTHQGTVTLGVERSSADGRDWLEFSVSDTGIGIEAAKLESVFQEFSQADETTTRDYGGTGLGLAISQRFVHMLGGELSVVSELGVGSTFTIRVPATYGAPAANQEEEEAEQEVDVDESARSDPQVHGASQDVRSSGSSGLVLVIDDDPSATEIIGRLLEKDGFRVIKAHSGEEGLRLARELKPVAITLDVMMPGMDGWTVLRALKADPELEDIPVVVLTMLDDKARGYSLGATSYLTKPVDRDRLHAALEGFPRPTAPRTVLLVEDDADTRALLTRLLAGDDWHVAEAVNGREALDQLERQVPALILLDLMMPVMDGFDFLLEMRARPEWQDIPVIVLTAKDLTEGDRQILSGRVEETIEKGARQNEQLLELVHQVIAGRPLSGESG